MSLLYSANHSTYPRVGESKEHLRLRRAYHDLDKKKISRGEFLSIQDTYVSEVIREQETTGLDVVTDGLIRWGDSLSHILKNCEGIEITGLLRFFDTNCYFRQPLIKGKVFKKNSFLETEALYLKKNATRKSKIVITGPVTLTTWSKIETKTYNTQSLAERLSELLKEEILLLAKTGVSQIQIEEPSLSFHPQYLPILKNLFEQLSLKKTELILASYFGDVSSIYEDLQDLKVDALLLDFTYSQKLTDRISTLGSQKKLGLGLLDGRNTRLETKKEVQSVLNKILPKLPLEGNFLTTSSGLEYLPRDRALRKLKHLTSLVRELNS